MQRIAAMRMTVPDKSTQDFEQQAEYLHYMAYDSDDAQALHLKIEHQPEGWAWGCVFRDFLVAPLESEAFTADSIVSAVMRAKQWHE